MAVYLTVIAVINKLIAIAKPLINWKYVTISTKKKTTNDRII